MYRKYHKYLLLDIFADVTTESGKVLTKTFKDFSTRLFWVFTCYGQTTSEFFDPDKQQQKQQQQQQQHLTDYILRHFPTILSGIFEVVMVSTVILQPS
jgi:hypothetical protein